jgi:predicted metal-dependent phosphoesterase TrpH
MHYQNGVLGTTLAKLREARRERVRKMVGELVKNGVQISADTIFGLAGKGSVGRPHVARALIDAGIAIDLRDAFERFLVPGRPGYITHNYLSATEALDLIGKSGGISVLAHPATGGAAQTIPELVELGLRGLEVYYENYNPDQVRRLERTAEKYHLVKTGGSDYHGEGGRSRPVKLGSVKLEDQIVQDLEDAAQSR